MKEFKKWFGKYKKDDPKHKDNFWYVLMKPFMEIAWKAAVKRVLLEMHNDKFKRNLELEDWIKKELKNEHP